MVERGEGEKHQSALSQLRTYRRKKMLAGQGYDLEGEVRTDDDKYHRSTSEWLTGLKFKSRTVGERSVTKRWTIDAVG